MPKYEWPQPHSLKVRIGSALSPKDRFQLIFTKDDAETSEFLEVESHGVCKIDFINNEIAYNIEKRVKEWHDGLPEIDDNLINKFIKKNGYILTSFFRSFLPFCLALSFCLIADKAWFLSFISHFINIKQPYSIVVLPDL